MKECLVKLADTLFPDEKTFAEVSLSRRTVERQIGAIAVIINVDFGKVVETCVASSIALEESTDIDTAQLASSFAQKTRLH